MPNCSNGSPESSDRAHWRPEEPYHQQVNSAPERLPYRSGQGVMTVASDAGRGLGVMKLPGCALRYRLEYCPEVGSMGLHRLSVEVMLSHRKKMNAAGTPGCMAS